MNNAIWYNAHKLDLARSHPAVAVYRNRIYAFGGGGRAFQSLNSSVVYDSDTRVWHDMMAMPSLRSGSVAVCDKDRILVMGGGFKQANGQFQFLRTVEIYYPEQNRWERGPDLLQPHDYPAVALLDGYVYVMGGHHPDAWRSGPKTDPGFAFCERLNLASMQWEQIADLPTPRFALAAVTVGSEIWCFGGVAFTPEGFNNFDMVEVYDPSVNRWRDKPELRLPWQAAGLGACVHQGKVYIFGGYSGPGIHAGAAVFEQAQWRSLPPMPSPRAAMGVASVSDGIYLIGGWADDGRTPVADVVRFS